MPTDTVLEETAGGESNPCWSVSKTKVVGSESQRAPRVFPHSLNICRLYFVATVS